MGKVDVASKRKSAETDSDDSSDEPLRKVVKASPSHKPLPKVEKPGKKLAAVSSDSSDEEPTPKAKAKPSPVKKPAVADSGSDSSQEEVLPKAKAKASTEKLQKTVAEDSESSDAEVPPKAKAKPAPAKSKADVVDSDTDSSSDEVVLKVKAKHTGNDPKVKAKAKDAPTKQIVADDSDSSTSDDEPVAKAKLKAKAGPKIAWTCDVCGAEHTNAEKENCRKPGCPGLNPAPIKKPSGTPLKKNSGEEHVAPKRKTEENDKDMGVSSMPKKPRLGEPSAHGAQEDRTVFIGGLSKVCDRALIKKHFGECGEIEKINMPLNDAGEPKGVAFVTYKTQAGAEAAFPLNGTEYGGSTLRVNLASQKPAKGEGKGKSKSKGNKNYQGQGNNDQRNDELTAFVACLPFSVEEPALRQHFEQFGEIERLMLPMIDPKKGKYPKGIAFIQYKTKEAVAKALTLEGTDYGGRTISVQMAGQGKKTGKGVSEDKAEK